EPRAVLIGRRVERVNLALGPAVRGMMRDLVEANLRAPMHHQNSSAAESPGGMHVGPVHASIDDVPRPSGASSHTSARRGVFWLSTMSSRPSPSASRIARFLANGPRATHTGKTLPSEKCHQGSRSPQVTSLVLESALPATPSPRNFAKPCRVNRGL